MTESSEHDGRETSEEVRGEDASQAALADANQQSPLRNFLASGSMKCPSCDYDLKGCEEAVCPECAWQLQLQLKPRMSFVPYWLFALMIYGWLIIWGFSGSLTTASRIWQYHGHATNRWTRQYNTAQANAMVNQFLSKADSLPPGGVLPPAGAVATPASMTPPGFTENVRNYLLAQPGVDQISIGLFFAAFFVGSAGLACAPFMRRFSSRVNSWLIVSGIVVFGAMILDHVLIYLAVLNKWG